MKMKRIVSLLLLTVMLMTAFCGCGEEEKTTTQDSSSEQVEEVWLPLGLKFGQSYDSFCKTLTDNGYTAPALTDEKTDFGTMTEFVSENDHDFNFDNSFLGSATLDKMAKSTDTLDKINYSYLHPEWKFAFNGKNELCEIVVVMSFASNDDGLHDHGIVSEITASFDKKFGTKSEPDGDILAFYKTDAMIGTIILEPQYILYRDKLKIGLYSKEVGDKKE